MDFSYKQKYLKYKNKYLQLKNQLVPDIDLIQDHGTDGSFMKWKTYNNIQKNDAFILEFDIDNKKLYYIGAMHTTDNESKTFQLIKKIIDYNPDIVLIEGIPFDNGISPDISYFQGEGKFAVELAKARHIPYSGIETNENEILQKLSEKYSIDDIYGFMYLRMQKYYFKTMQLSEKEMIDDFDKYTRNNLDKLFGKQEWDFNRWFLKTFNKKFKYGKNLESGAPYKNSEDISRQISFDLSTQRDISNIKNLYKFLNEYDNVLYIMGQNHVHADIKVLENTFGKFKIIKN
ncbi:MAG: hypothetical protein Edafosvirus1_88 [Edafosvirus sp.]|uniref:Uncharacterized protein n=1 Tax=Edafosvirus sp. TaxID=2487765 RepID=A0A3G4ZS86_9VIRU|nr:MAG: hypothetical protein Edafosvirus1_88 [Edafosvirus sp.]